MTKDELESLQQAVACEALQLRERLETAVHVGELPMWVREAADVLERAVLLYGASSNTMRARLVIPVKANSSALH